MKTLIKIICTGACLFLNNKVVYARQEPEQFRYNNFYIDFSIGKTNNGIIMAQGGMSVQYKNSFYKLKIVTLHQPYEKDRRHEDDPIPGVAAINLMLGKSYTFLNRHQIQFGTGISLVQETAQIRIDEPGYYTYHNKYQEYYSAGLPAEIRYNFFISRGIALNCTAYGNTNTIKSFTGLTAGVLIGMY